MHYINPFDLLEITSDNLSDVNGSAIKKARRELLNEVELSDTKTIQYNGTDLTKSDCIKAIDDLDNKDKIEFHFFIFQNEHINKFLSKGTLSFFDNYKAESIYKLPEFIDFISPFFSKQYDRLLSENYKKGNLENVSKMLSVKPITNKTYFEKCYKSTHAFLRDIYNDIEKINTNIENKSSSFIEQNFKGLLQTVSNKVNVPLLNVLPSYYFQSIRNQIAHSIRDIEVKLYNDPYNNYTTAFQLIEFAKSINSDGLALQTITKSYYIVKTQFESDQNKTPVVSNTSATVKDDEEQEEIKTETKAEKKNYAYWIFCCIFLGVGFFYEPVQKIILGFSLLILLIPLWAAYKKTEFSFSYFLKNNFLFIAAASLGFFYPLIAQLFISYYFLAFLNTLYDEATVRKENWGFYTYLIGAMLMTFILSYVPQIGNEKLDTKSNEHTEVIEDSPKTPEEFYQKGNALGKSGDIRNAINAFQQAISLNPNYFDAYLASAFYKIRVEDYQGAIDDCNKANTLNKNNADVYNHRGYAKYRLKQLDEAMKDFNKAIEINPQYANAYRNRGEIKYDRNDNQGAAKDYSLAIQYDPQDPQNPAYFFARGLAYYYLKDYSKAITDMDRAIELNPNVAQYYYDRGDTKEKNNDILGACSDWKTANEKGYSVSEYKLNICISKVIVMENGNISGCNFKPVYASPALDNQLKIKVGNTDVAVKLINLQTGKCVRYVFINQSTTYSITNIPEGKYYMKIAYGEDWAKTTKETNCQGRFTKNTLFKKSDKILDYNLIETNDGWQVPSFELELKVIVTEGSSNDFNQFNSSIIFENDFYKE